MIVHRCYANECAAFLLGSRCLSIATSLCYCHTCNICSAIEKARTYCKKIMRYIRVENGIGWPQAGNIGSKTMGRRTKKANSKWACYSGPFLQGGSGTESTFLILRSCSGRQVGFDCRKYKPQSINRCTDMWTAIVCYRIAMASRHG